LTRDLLPPPTPLRLTVVIPRDPFAWMRAVPVRRGRQVRMANPAEQRAVAETIRRYVADAMRAAGIREPITGPVAMSALFVLKRPASLKGSQRRWHAVKPDRDNLLKLVQDACNGLLYKDDSQICSGPTWKLYGRPDEKPHSKLTFRSIECGDLPDYLR